MCSYEYGLLSMMRGRLRRNQRIGRRRELGRGSGSFRCWISHALLSSVPVSGKVTEHKTRLYKISEFCTTGIFDGNTYPIHSSGLKKDGFKIGLVFQVKKRTVEKKKRWRGKITRSKVLTSRRRGRVMRTNKWTSQVYMTSIFITALYDDFWIPAKELPLALLSIATISKSLGMTWLFLSLQFNY